MNYDIICKFGRFGSTVGALLAYNQIGCPTPKITEDIGQEMVDLEISLNGYDFSKTYIPFKFIGTGYYTLNHGFTWAVSIFIGLAILVCILFVFVKALATPADGTKPSQKKLNIPVIENPTIELAPRSKIIFDNFN